MNKKIEKLKKTSLSRTLSVAKTGLRTGGSWATHNIGNILRSDKGKKEAFQDFLKDQAELLSNELGKLKGSMMKIGQMISVHGEHFLPEKANALLKKMQFQSPPLIWESIAETLENELRPSLRDELEIEKEPIASASLGQVHRAKIKSTGEDLAVKMQYPSLGDATESDLKTLKRILKVSKILPAEIDVDEIFVEIYKMLKQELNYLTELKLMEEYRSLLNSDRYLIPKAYPRYSTEKILTMEFMDADNVDSPAVDALPQEVRNQLGCDYLDLYFKELFEWGFIQTDAHFGNYKIKIEGDTARWVLLDFGATKRIGKEFSEPYTHFISSLVKGDKAALIQASYRLKFLREGDPQSLEDAFWEFCLISVEPFQSRELARSKKLKHYLEDGRYDWGKTDLAERTIQLTIALKDKFPFRAPPADLIFLNRKLSGVFTILTKLKAQIHSRDVMAKYLNLS